MPEHGIADDAATRQAKLAVDSRAFPLFTYDPRRGERLAERLSLQGNPALRDDWATAPDGSAVDFLDVRPHRGPVRRRTSAPTAPPSPEIEATQADRLGELAHAPGAGRPPRSRPEWLSAWLEPARPRGRRASCGWPRSG